MRLKILVMTLLISLPSMVLGRPEHFHLRDYVLTAEQIKKLSPKDQATYLTFLYHFVAVIEASQAKDRWKRGSGKNALLKIFRDLHFDWSFLSEVNAAERSHFKIFGYNPEGRELNAAYMKSLGTIVTNYFKHVSASHESNLIAPGFDVAAATVANSRVPAAGGEPPGDIGAPPPDATISGQGSGAVADARTAATNAAAFAAQAEAAAAVPATKYRVAGASCLFGGYVSKYIIRRGNGLRCPAPRGKINSGTCIGTRQSPKFKCNSFGMESGPQQEAVQTATCIDARPLTDLTVRCTAAITAWIQTSAPNHMDAAAFTAWRTEIIKHLDEYENTFAPGKKFSEYCASSNALNDRRQENECKAIETLFAKLRSLSQAAIPILASAQQQNLAAEPPALLPTARPDAAAIRPAPDTPNPTPAVVPPTAAPPPPSTPLPVGRSLSPRTSGLCEDDRPCEGAR